VSVTHATASDCVCVIMNPPPHIDSTSNLQSKINNGTGGGVENDPFYESEI